MSRDPYIDAKGEVEANIGNLNALLGSYSRISSTSQDSASLRETADELRNTLGLLETDLEDLDECVRVVEGHGDRWGIDPSEVRNRRTFVNRLTDEVQRLRTKVQQVTSKSTAHPQRYRDDIEMQPTNDTEEAERWEREEQQMLMQRQDSTLGVISGTLSSLASQAGLIGQEVEEHGVMLDDLSTRVDTTQSRLSKVNKTIQEFIRKNESSRSSWCIAILIVILIILLVAVILV